MKNFLHFLREAFSENGSPSSKRIIGGFMILVITLCTGWSVLTYGMTDNNKAVIEIEIISGCSLLGLSSVTSIWKNNEGPTVNYPTGGTDPNITNPDEEDA